MQQQQHWWGSHQMLPQQHWQQQHPQHQQAVLQEAAQPLQPTRVLQLSRLLLHRYAGQFSWKF